jgi:hypothetical protein
MVGCPFDRLSCGADLARSALPVAVGLCLLAAAPIDGQSGGSERVLLERFEFSKTRGHAIGAPRLTIAPRVWRQEITWQLIEASIAVSIGSACSVRTSVRHGPLSLPNHMGQPIFAAARDAGWQPRRAGRHDPPAGPLPLLSPTKRAQAQS